eukprot:4570298-Amphidinium_carterae.1
MPESFRIFSWEPSWGEVQITAEDCSDYFYMLRLPHHLHPHTVIGWDLPRQAIDPLQLEHDQKGRVLHDSDSFAAALMVVPMGDKRAMELAQAAHQHLHLRAGTLLSRSQLSHAWMASSSTVAAESARRLDRVKNRYTEERLQLKQSKEQLRAKEATVWGACLSSSRCEVRGDLVKMKALVVGTTEAVKARRISTHTMQRLVGHWVHHCLYQRSALCVLNHTYQWIEKGKSQPYRLRLMPGFVKQELQGFILLFPLIRADLGSCLCPEIFASDATEHVGAVVKASASLEDMVLAWTRRTHHLSPGYA